MRVLVTGGAGFVGVHIVRGLVSRGARVVSLSGEPHLDPSAQALLGEAIGQVAHVQGDVTDCETVRALFREYAVECIVHAAAVTGIGDLERRSTVAMVHVNLAGTAVVLEAARLESVKRFVQVSSATVYGRGDTRCPIKETQPARPEDLYGITKETAERIVLRCAVLFGLDAVIVRLSSPYGPLERVTAVRELMSPTYHWCRAALAGEPLEVGPDLERDFTYVEDVGDGVARIAMTAGLPERTYNLAAGRNYRYSEVLEVLKDLVPALAIRRSDDKGAEFFRTSLRGPLDISRARRDIGFAPTTLRDGLGRYIQWLTRHPV